MINVKQLTMEQLNIPREVNWKGKYIYVDGIRIHYLEKGLGEPLLLVHGLGAYSYTWRYNIDALAQHYRVIAIDLKGFGLSDKPKGRGYSIHSHM